MKTKAEPAHASGMLTVCMGSSPTSITMVDLRRERRGEGVGGGHQHESAESPTPQRRGAGGDG